MTCSAMDGSGPRRCFCAVSRFGADACVSEYSADFSTQAYVMKGASPVTARDLLRRSFRNWFRPHYPYVYASFRCVSERAS